jgi:hypothetical protein
MKDKYFRTKRVFIKSTAYEMNECGINNSHLKLPIRVRFITYIVCICACMYDIFYNQILDELRMKDTF